VQTWEEIKRKQQIPLSIATNVEEYIKNRCGLMQEQLTMVNQLIRNQKLSDVSFYGGHIQIPSLKKDVPDDVADLTRAIYDVLPRIKLTELLVEV
ncbi:hypothetical protein, partial [Bacillus mycoides]|uniref:hypothetical protein n=1 Tax=Bacillus mycoides TaxID=1405 RepID=UPI002845EC84